MVKAGRGMNIEGVWERGEIVRSTFLSTGWSVVRSPGRNAMFSLDQGIFFYLKNDVFEFSKLFLKKYNEYASTFLVTK